METIENPRWLDQEQQDVWRSWLHASARIDQYLDADLRTFGLDLAEYEILVALSEAPKWQTRMSELADAVHQSRSRLTHTISRMENRGYVERLTCQADGRGVWAHLTADGYALLEKTAPHHVEGVRRILVDAVDPEDLRALGRAMKAVLAVAD